MIKIKIKYTVFCLLAFTCSFRALMAQTIHNKAQVIAITPNTLVTVHGGIRNEGILINNGTINLSGDWINPGQYDHGTGKVVLSGVEEQTLDHNAQLIHALEILGGGNKKIISDATIMQSLLLVNGIVSPEPGKILLLQNNTTVSGGSSNSFVNGTLYHSGTGYKFFPIGKDRQYRPVELLDVLGINPVTGFEVFSGNPYQRYGSIFKSISQRRHWIRTQLSGTYSGSLISLTLGADDGLSNPDDLLVADANMESQIYNNLGNAGFSGDANAGTVRSEMAVTGSIVAIGVYSGFTDNRTLYVPNVLSPNAANVENQVIKVYGEEIDAADFSFQVYNRWGNLIFSERSYEKLSTNGWTGFNFKTGEMESIGVYKYVLTGKFKSGHPFEQVGNITIVR